MDYNTTYLDLTFRNLTELPETKINILYLF